MRPVTVVSVVLALGLGGVALAQPQPIVDPWPRSSNGANAWFAVPTPASSLADPAEFRDPWAPQEVAAVRAGTSSSKRAVNVLPLVTSGLERQDQRGERFAEPRALPLVPRVASGLVSEARAPKPRATSTPRTATWAARFKEIVDPWQRTPNFVASTRVKLIVDPWSASR